MFKPNESKTPEKQRSPSEQITTNNPTEGKTLTPNTRKRKSYLAKNISDTILSMNLSEDDQVDVVSLALKQLNILDKIRFIRKPTAKGRKLLPAETRESVWKFWHDNTFESTNSNQHSKLRVTEKPRVQDGLEFSKSVIIVDQRHRSFYQGIHRIADQPFRILYSRYLRENNPVVSFGTFFALKPFYVKHTTEKDIEMCCCKQHLHAKWCVEAIVKC